MFLPKGSYPSIEARRCVITRIIGKRKMTMKSIESDMRLVDMEWVGKDGNVHKIPKWFINNNDIDWEKTNRSKKWEP